MPDFLALQILIWWWPYENSHSYAEWSGVYIYIQVKVMPCAYNLIMHSHLIIAMWKSEILYLLDFQTVSCSNHAFHKLLQIIIISPKLLCFFGISWCSRHRFVIWSIPRNTIIEKGSNASYHVYCLYEYNNKVGSDG